MTRANRSTQRVRRWLINWLLTEAKPEENRQQRQYAWWQVMCLTGVDYFSTLGYQPGIAALAAGSLSPLATMILVLLTLFGALPIYRRVATKSPQGEGSISMLEQLLSRWRSKLLVLCLLGFVATDFIITITLSAADAAAHLSENPLVSYWLGHQQFSITLVLVALLGAVFFKGFTEAIGIAIVLVGVYLLLNLVVISAGLYQIWHHPATITNWQMSLFADHHNPLIILGIAILLFPKLALGLSGFETGVVVMPLVQGCSSDSPAHPTQRIRNTHKLLTTAAGIMSLLLLTSSFVTTLLIPPAAFQAGGEANGRALAYLAHLYLGNSFGTIYDVSTIAILWFAGASAMAGLLNIVPRYLPRYGMAPEWARKVRPLVLVYTVIAFAVTIVFKASVDAQGGAYATGVLVLISSAAFAVALAARTQRIKRDTLLYSSAALVFLYTTIVNIVERPEGIKIAACFISAIIIISFASRVWRSTELRVERVEIDAVARRFIEEQSRGELQIIANQLDAGAPHKYSLKEQEVREDNHIPATEPVLFLEVIVADASKFIDVVTVKGIEFEGYRILRAKGAAIPNSIAAILLYLRDQTGKLPNIYFRWSNGNPLRYLLRFILFGEGDVPLVTYQVLRQAEKDAKQRPNIHING